MWVIFSKPYLLVQNKQNRFEISSRNFFQNWIIISRSSNMTFSLVSLCVVFPVSCSSLAFAINSYDLDNITSQSKYLNKDKCPSQLSLELSKVHLNPYQRAAQQIQFNSKKNPQLQVFYEMCK